VYMVPMRVCVCGVEVLWLTASPRGVDLRGRQVAAEGPRVAARRDELAVGRGHEHAEPIELHARRQLCRRTVTERMSGATRIVRLQLCSARR
jgi:hypothetical protein